MTCLGYGTIRRLSQLLNAVEREVPAGKVIHTCNYATDKHPKVLAWLARHPRWTLPLHPDLGLLAQENFFSEITRQRIRRGVFRSIVDLQTAINAHLVMRALTGVLRSCFP